VFVLKTAWSGYLRLGRLFESFRIYLEIFRPDHMQLIRIVANYDPVAWCVCQSVCHAPVPCKNGWTDRGPFFGFDFCMLKELCIRWRYRFLRRSSITRSRCVQKIYWYLSENFMWGVLVMRCSNLIVQRNFVLLIVCAACACSSTPCGFRGLEQTHSISWLDVVRGD